jgi:hypothetical protein
MERSSLSDMKLQIVPKDGYIYVIDHQHNKRSRLNEPDDEFIMLIREKQYVLLTSTGAPASEADYDRIAVTIEDFVMPYLQFRLEEQGVIVKNLWSVKGCHQFNEDAINHALSEINEKLKGKCPGYELRFDAAFDLGPGKLSLFSDYIDWPTICLFKGDDCIASVMLEPKDNGSIDLYSFTHKDYEKRKYNRLLRACGLLLASVLVCGGAPGAGAETGLRFGKLISIAENPVSAYLLMDMFTVESVKSGDDDTAYAEYTERHPENSVFQFYKDTGDYLNLVIDIKANIDRANEWITRLLSDGGITC